VFIETAPPVGRRRLAIILVAEDRSSTSFAEHVREGLTARSKTLPCRYFYDPAGSHLFEQICELPEYYLTRTEDAILSEHAPAMVSGWARAPVLIELGSGSSNKTRRLISAGLEAYGSLHYAPIDVSTTILEASARDLIREYARLRVTGFAGDYLPALSSLLARFRAPKLVVFLGSSLGNYERPDAIALLNGLSRAMRPHDRLLLGTDLVKHRATLEAAYDDQQGVTAAFNRNILTRINRELGGNFILGRFEHRAHYRTPLSRVEMHLVSRLDHQVQIPGARLVIDFAAGESIHTESSHKYTVESLHDLAANAGFIEESAWTDRDGLFRIQRWRPL
jgi:dimethylhistidine N-methyltransferase